MIHENHRRFVLIRTDKQTELIPFRVQYWPANSAGPIVEVQSCGELKDYVNSARLKQAKSDKRGFVPIQFFPSTARPSRNGILAV